MSKHAVKKLPLVIRNVLGWYKTQQMCNNAILENGGYFTICSYLLQNLKMWNKAVYNNPQALKSVRDCNITSKICQYSSFYNTICS